MMSACTVDPEEVGHNRAHKISRVGPRKIASSSRSGSRPDVIHQGSRETQLRAYLAQECNQLPNQSCDTELVLPPMVPWREPGLNVSHPARFKIPYIWKFSL